MQELPDLFKLRTRASLVFTTFYWQNHFTDSGQSEENGTPQEHYH